MARGVAARDDSCHSRYRTVVGSDIRLKVNNPGHKNWTCSAYLNRKPKVDVEGNTLDVEPFVYARRLFSSVNIRSRHPLYPSETELSTTSPPVRAKLKGTALTERSGL